MSNQKESKLKGKPKNKIKDEDSPITDVPVYVSLADLVYYFKDILYKAEQEAVYQQKLEEILIDAFGFDKDYKIEGVEGFYEIMNCTHRARNGNIVTCDRFVGSERLDKCWLNSGFASDEAKLAAKGDKSLIETIERMKHGGE